MTLEFDRPRRLFAEGLGTAMLLATIVGSGIMAADLSGGNDGLALLGNTLPTGAILVVLILIFGPVSGAHFNPAVTLAFALRREISVLDALIYAIVQIIGGVLGVVLAHAMFDLPLLQVSQTVRQGFGHSLSEVVAAFALIGTILGTLKTQPKAVPYAVGLVITAGYWFTASTCFANPAVTIARAFSDTFAGIAPSGVPSFIMAQCGGSIVAVCLFGWLFGRQQQFPISSTNKEGSQDRQQVR